jgi:hypothetical protein
LFSTITVGGEKVDSTHTRTHWTLLVYFTIACSSTRASLPALPAPSLPPVINPSSTVSWTFSYSPGTAQYQISRSAAIEGRSDSSSSREISTNITRELITLTPAADSGIGFTAVVDTFSSTTQGLIGPVQPVQLPIQVSGILADSGLIIRGDRNNDKCNPVSSAVASDLHNLLTRFPVQLSQGLVWRDSVSTSGCQATIPTSSRTIRSYVVLGESAHEGRPVVVIQRTDTIQAEGEGAQQQHPIKLNAGGTGRAIYYLDTTGGYVVRLTSDQELVLTIITSSKAYQFKQSSRQDFRLTR